MQAFAAWTLVLVLAGGLLLLVLGVRGSVRARSVPGPRATFIPAALVGCAVTCFALFGAGFWPFGGRISGGGVTPDFLACSAWWTELPPHQHRRPDDYRSAHYCHTQAVDAVAPVLAVSVAIGLAAGIGIAIVIAWRRRRFDAALNAVAAGPG